MAKMKMDSLLRVFLWDQLFQQDQDCPTKQKEKNVSNLGYETCCSQGSGLKAHFKHCTKVKRNLENICKRMMALIL